MVVVHQLASRHSRAFFFRTEVDMDFRARSAWSCITHFPEVVMLVTVYDMILRHVLCPVTCSFVVAFKSFFRASFEHCCIKVFRVNLEYINQELPCPRDSFLLEIIAERPVTQHFEHSVVVCVVTHFFQVVMFSAHTQTFLRVCHTLVFGRMISQYNVLELVHTCIGKHQCRVVLNHHWCRRHNLMSFRLEKLYERVADFICCQHIYIL